MVKEMTVRELLFRFSCSSRVVLKELYDEKDEWGDPYLTTREVYRGKSLLVEKKYWNWLVFQMDVKKGDKKWEPPYVEIKCWPPEEGDERK